MKKLLIVDDEKEFIEIISHLLKIENFEVRSETTLDGAKNSIDSESFDIILFDIRMGKDNGLDLIKLAKTKKIPIVIMSASIEFDFESVTKMGADHFYKKPMDVTLLISKLKDLVS